MKKFLRSYGTGLAGLLCIILFCCVGFAVRSNSGFLFSLDRIVQEMLLFRSWETLEWMRFITDFAVGVPLTVTYGAGLVFFILYRQWKPAAGLAVGFWIIQLCTWPLKEFFDRPRPEDMLAYASGGSYPSGHTTGAVIVLLFIAYGLCKILKLRYAQVIAVILGVTAMLLVGLSRIYLNVHWLSDVYGAYLLCLGVFLITLQILDMKKSHR